MQRYLRISGAALAKRRLRRVTAAYVVLAVALGAFGGNLGVHWFGVTVSRISASSATALLSAIASGMMAFTGIVFSFVFLILQFGSATYSPRLVTEIGNDDAILAHALGVFSGTFLYALFAIRTVDAVGNPGVNLPVVIMAALWLLASIVVLLLLLPRLTGLLVGGVLERLGRRGAEVIARIYPRSPNGVDSSWHDDGTGLRQPVSRAVCHRGDVGYVIAIHLPALVDAAARAGAVVSIPHAIGDAVLPGEAIAYVHGGGPAVSDHDVSRAIQIGPERVLINDPAYALRLLVDIAIRALSPAVNDPTTAVNAIDRIEALLVALGRSDLAIGHVEDATGALRVVYRTPSWDALVLLATAEILSYGRDSLQVERRIGALLERLLRTLPPARHDTIRRLVTYHQIAGEPEVVPDLQGLGLVGDSAAE